MIHNSAPPLALFKGKTAPPSEVTLFSKTAPGWTRFGSTFFLSVVSDHPGGVLVKTSKKAQGAQLATFFLCMSGEECNEVDAEVPHNGWVEENLN